MRVSFFSPKRHGEQDLAILGISLHHYPCLFGLKKETRIYRVLSSKALLGILVRSKAASCPNVRSAHEGRPNMSKLLTLPRAFFRVPGLREQLLKAGLVPFHPIYNRDMHCSLA